MNSTIGFIGAGNMASSLIGGMINKGFSPENILACDPSEEQLEKLKSSVDQGQRLQLFADSKNIDKADIVVLAVKPQILKTVALDLAPRLIESAMVISIAAGIDMNSLESWLGNCAIVRCMPNTPALIELGAAGLFANSLTTEDQKNEAKAILESVGTAYWVDSEKLIDVVTAVSGSGPAYFFMFMEYMTEIGVEMGLPADISEALAVQTCLGAGALANNSENDLSTLRENVTSKGGTTYAALESFRANDLKKIVAKAMQACADRAAEMAEEFGDQK